MDVMLCTELAVPRAALALPALSGKEKRRIRRELTKVASSRGTWYAATAGVIPLRARRGSGRRGKAAITNCCHTDQMSSNASLPRAEATSSYSLECSTSGESRVPVFVMMPLDTVAVGEQPKLKRIRSLNVALRALKLAGVDGVMVDVWWGVVERKSPLVYDWSVYQDLFKMVAEAGLKLQVVLSFHACAESLMDLGNCIDLPLWVTEIGRFDNSIYYTDRRGYFSTEYLSAGVDRLPLFYGRTALQCYEDFMQSFMETFRPMLGEVIREITVGLGPSGELRYPSYPMVDGRWRFPGIGEFQCYDKYMMADLREAAREIGEPRWGLSGPSDAGHYNSSPWEAPFFQLQVGTFASDYGRFFLEWYSGKLIEHADEILSRAANILRENVGDNTTVNLGAKVAGVHWWYRSHSHAAELTAGYYNTSYRDGYAPIAAVFARHGVALNFPCVEMLDSEHPERCYCSPEGLLAQMTHVAQHANIPITGENAMQRFDEAAFDRIVRNTYHWPTMQTFTFLRMGESLFTTNNWRSFVRFIRHMCCGSKQDGDRPNTPCGDLCKSF